jgi:hypothetical protein
MKLRIGVLAVAATAALSLAACSSSSSGGSNQTTTTAGTTTSAAATTPASTPADTMSSSASGANAAYCAKVAQVSQQVSSLQGGLTALGTGDTAKAKAALLAAAAYFTTLKDGAPAELQTPLNTLSSDLQQAEAQFNSGTPDVAKLATLLTGAAPSIQAFTQWAATNCAAS